MILKYGVLFVPVCLCSEQPKKVKNVSVDGLGTQVGRIHMKKQDLDQVQIRKTKALKRRPVSDTETSPAKRKRSE